jgi:acetylornithine/N-succinyldiaminopimelate aminotransferase
MNIGLHHERNTMAPSVMEQADSVITQTYKRFPVVMVSGEGCTLRDDQGKNYIDFVAGIAVCNLGHAHPDIVAALSRQAQTLFHVSNLYYTEPQTKLAAKLVAKSFADRVFFCNSGAEANEAAIKLARKYFSLKGDTERYRIIAMEQSFHGRTMAALSATGQDKIREGFDPILQGFDFVPFNDIEALRGAIGPSICAIMMEPIQGEGGVRVPDPEYLKQVRQLCDESGILLIFDEIQTGMGRTGKLFAYEHYGVAPDIMSLAKALGNGLPIGAMLAREQVAQAFGPGVHASTFGGTPVVTAAALAVLEVFERDGVVEQGAATGAYFRNRLEELKKNFPVIEDVRGEGLLLGMKLKTDGAPIVAACMQRGFLINCIQDRILRFVPPLTVETEQIDALIDCLDDIFKNL